MLLASSMSSQHLGTKPSQGQENCRHPERSRLVRQCTDPNTNIGILPLRHSRIPEHSSSQLIETWEFTCRASKCAASPALSQCLPIPFRNRTQSGSLFISQRRQENFPEAEADSPLSRFPARRPSTSRQCHPPIQVPVESVESPFSS